MTKRPSIYAPNIFEVAVYDFCSRTPIYFLVSGRLDEVKFVG
jgi:hypothetical protein